jgi:hypothetical protein
MEPERWREIERLYQAAQERETGERGRFLQEACGSDLELRHEVESLLGHTKGAEIFLETPALHIAARALGNPEHSMTHRRLGRYEIESLLGVGGMGEVYRAKDTRLGRMVAIKILPAPLAHYRIRGRGSSVRRVRWRRFPIPISWLFTILVKSKECIMQSQNCLKVRPYVRG